MRRAPLKIAIVVAAAAAAIVPMPAAVVERFYSRGLYPPVQRVLTAASNLIPIALFDLAIAGVAVALGVRVRRAVRTGGWRLGLRRGGIDLVVWGAAAYLLFLALWGLNYRRVPIERQVDFDASRVTQDAIVEKAHVAIDYVNDGYAAARAPADMVVLRQAFEEAHRLMGGRQPARTGVPKWSLLSWYFRWAAIDGMTDPYFLEIIVNPDVLPIERPFVVAHEWAHLAGYADESEANFMAWLTCARADATARYSGWLRLSMSLLNALPRAAARDAAARFAPGPRQDLDAIAQRFTRSAPVVRTAAHEVYDSYLKANRVPEGIRSYEAVVRLVVGTRFESGWTPVFTGVR